VGADRVEMRRPYSVDPLLPLNQCMILSEKDETLVLKAAHNSNFRRSLGEAVVNVRCVRMVETKVLTSEGGETRSSDPKILELTVVTTRHHEFRHDGYGARRAGLQRSWLGRPSDCS